MRTSARTFLIILILGALLVSVSSGYEINYQVAVLSYPVFVYSNPAEDSQAIGIPHKGDSFVILQKKKGQRRELGQVAEDFWYKIEFDNQEGWIFGGDVRWVEDNEKTLLTKFQAAGVDKSEIIQNLGLIKSAKAKALFLSLINDKQNKDAIKFRKNLIEALGMYRDPELAQLFVSALNDENWSVRWNAMEALGNYQDVSLAKNLIPLLKSGDRRVKAFAIKILSTFTDGEVKSALAQNQENLTEIIASLRLAYIKQEPGFIAYNLNKTRGFYLVMPEMSGTAKTQRHLPAAETLDFFNGKFTPELKASKLLSINNVPDFTVTGVYAYPGEFILGNTMPVTFYTPDSEFIEKHDIKEFQKYLLISIEWQGYRKHDPGDYRRAYLHLLKEEDKWFLVGMDVVYQ